MSEKRLTADLNIVRASNVEIQYFDGDLNIIAKLDNEPNDVGGLSAEELKATFDKAGNLIKEYINETLIPAILASDATEEARDEAEAQREKNEAQRQANEKARSVFEAYSDTGSYAVGNKVAYGGSSYVCIAPCTGVAPPEAAHWLLMAKRGDIGPQGLSGATVSADGAYGFDVADGHLRLHYTGDTAPDFDLDEDGHLILTLDSGKTVDLGRVVGSDYVLTDEDKAEIAKKVPVATAERAGTVKAGTDFDVAEDGTLSLYKALTLIANVVPATVEKGAMQTTATVKWATNKTPVSVTVEGESVSPDTTSKELTGLQITAEKTFTVAASDSRGSQTATAVMRFCNGVYTGAAAAPVAVDSGLIRTLTKTLQSGRSKTFTVNAAAGQYIWYACPANYGTPVFNVGGFDGGFSKVATLDYTNPSGYTESYQVWRSDNAGLGQTTVKVS